MSVNIAKLAQNHKNNHGMTRETEMTPFQFYLCNSISENRSICSGSVTFSSSLFCSFPLQMNVVTDIKSMSADSLRLS